MQPMNYTLNAGDTGAAFDQGFNRQAGLMATVADYQKSQLMMQAQQQKMEMEAQKRADFQAVATNPTVKGYQRLITMYPELHEGVSKAASMLGDQDKRTIKQLGGSLAMAITKGKPESGVALIDQYIESAKNSGDESNRQRFEMLRDSVIANPDGALFGLHGMMQSVMDGKEYADWSKGIEEAEKIRQTRDFDVREAGAKASKAETDAKYAGEKARTDIENTRSTIEDRKFDQRIKSMEVALSKETNGLKREELQIKIDEARAKKDETARIKTAEADTAISSVRTTQALLSDVLGDEETLRAATGAGAWRGSIPGTESRAMAGKIEQLQNALAAENLDRLKGAMSDKDIMFIKNISANLDRYQDEEKLIGELKRVKQVLADAEARTLKKYGQDGKQKEQAPSPDALTRLKQKYGIQ